MIMSILSSKGSEKWGTFCVGVSLYNSIEDVVLGSLKFLFQLDHQVGMSLYLAKATPLRHSKELAFFDNILMNF